MRRRWLNQRGCRDPDSAMRVTHQHRQWALPLEELEEFVKIHAHMYKVPPAALEDILGRIDIPSGDGDGAWPVEWLRAGQRLQSQGKYLDAARHYSLGRFPFIDGSSRAEAQKRCLEAFDRWVHRQRNIDRLILMVDGQRVPAYGANMAAPAPALVLMGGVVSLKEQWYQFLKAELLGMPVVALDFPGTGESPFAYDERSPEHVGVVLDAALKRVGVDRCVVFASSFSGAIFAQLAPAEPRIRGLIMHSSPLHHFFLDRAWWDRVPVTTRLSLAATMRQALADAEAELPRLAVKRQDLAALRVPVVYIASLRDEIVPAGDWEMIEELVPAGRVIGFDDVHAAPDHTRQAGLEIMSAALDMAGRQRSLAGVLVGVMRRLGRRR